MRNACFVKSRAAQLAFYVFAVGLYAAAAPINAEDFKKIGDFDHGTIWLRGYNDDPKTLLQNLQSKLPVVLNHAIFKSKIPQHWDILLDGEWKKSPGYWANDLKSPDGNPALLFTPSTLFRDSGLALIAHELTHMIHHQYRPAEEAWIREGAALLAEYLVTGYFNPSMELAFTSPETSLIADFDPEASAAKEVFQVNAQYGHVLLYFYYLHRVCGNPRMPKTFFNALLTIDSSQVGMNFMDVFLKSLVGDNPIKPYCQDFKNSFMAFETARFMNDPNKDFTYVLITRLKPAVRETAPNLPPYSAGAYKRATPSCPGEEISWDLNCIRIRLK